MEHEPTLSARRRIYPLLSLNPIKLGSESRKCTSSVLTCQKFSVTDVTVAAPCGCGAAERACAHLMHFSNLLIALCNGQGMRSCLEVCSMLFISEVGRVPKYCSPCGR